MPSSEAAEFARPSCPIARRSRLRPRCAATWCRRRGSSPDEWPGYTKVGREYVRHDKINHLDKVYVSGDVHTNTIEGFFGNMKNGIRGNYHTSRRSGCRGYVNEYAWRYNHRSDGRAMFHTLILRAAA